LLIIVPVTREFSTIWPQNFLQWDLKKKFLNWMKNFSWKSFQENRLQGLKNHPTLIKGGQMNIYENEELDQKLETITDLMGDFILDVVLMSLKKISNESLIFQELNEIRLETAKEDIHIKKEPDF
jgi:hypothetical protein